MISFNYHQNMEIETLLKLKLISIFHLLSLEESYIDDGGVEVDKLENEHFKYELVVKLRLGTMHLCKQTQTNIYKGMLL